MLITTGGGKEDQERQQLAQRWPAFGDPVEAHFAVQLHANSPVAHRRPADIDVNLHYARSRIT